MNRQNLAFLVVVLMPVLLGMSGDDIPTSIRYKHADSFAWISASKAFDDAGNLRAELFGPFADALLRNLAANSDGTCHQFLLQSPSEASLRDGSLAEMSSSARTIVSGDVVSVQPGFYDAMPGTLIAVGTDHLFIQSAKFVIPAGALCSTPLANVPVPQIGDRVIAFTFFPPTDRLGLILPLDPHRHLIIERGRERVFTPVQLEAETAGLRVDEIAARARTRK